MRPGDHIKVRRGGYEHHGVVHSTGYVIHFTDVRPQKSAAYVQLTTLEAFAAGGKVEVVHYGQRVTAAVAVDRAERDGATVAVADEDVVVRAVGIEVRTETDRCVEAM